MAVVIRLQRLSMSAGSDDIRKFFSGLRIPDGGVHIIGGEREEAFIIFASDEDARRAMTRSGGCIHGSPVVLLLSSKSEMQNILVASAKKMDQKHDKEGFRRRESEGATPSSSENRRYPEMGNGSFQDSHGGVNRKAETKTEDNVYVLLRGLPFSVTENELRHFFQGLLIDSMILTKNHRGQSDGKGLVKFRTSQDARESWKRDRQYIGSRFVEVYRATEAQWLEAGGAMVEGVDDNPESRSGPSPAYTQRYQQDRARSRSPVSYRSKSPSPSNNDFCVLLENLSYSVQKSDVKELFRHADIHDDQILFLLDSEGKRTRSLFVLFRSQRDYSAALAHHKQEFLNRCVYISSISKEKMTYILDKVEQGRYSRSQERLPPPQSDRYDSERVCLHVRNLPVDVPKIEIMNLFHGFNISVILLCDNKGAGLGEALVIFDTEAEAMKGMCLNGQRFLGSFLGFKSLSRSEMREFGLANPALKVQTPRERSTERYSASEASLQSRDVKYSDFRVRPEDDIPLSDLRVHIQGGSSLYSNSGSPYGPHDGGSGPLHDGFAPPAMHFQHDSGNGSFHGVCAPPALHYGPTCVKLDNLPFQITLDEIYDFCYGYCVMPGSVSLQRRQNGLPNGSATVVFESRQEALNAIEELSGRPMGTRKIRLGFA